MGYKRLRRLREEWLCQPGAACWFCGGRFDLPADATDAWEVAAVAASIEHLRPRCNRGGNHDDNLVLTHRFCNNILACYLKWNEKYELRTKLKRRDAAVVKGLKRVPEYLRNLLGVTA